MKDEQDANLLVRVKERDAALTHEVPRYDWSVGENLEKYWASIPDATKQPLVILAGMSQMYAGYNGKPSDPIIVELLDDRLSPRGIRAFGLAAPNLNNEEALLYLLALGQDPRTKPRKFVYGVCFDKFRNVDLRPGLLRFLRSRPEFERAWREACATARDLYPMACEKMAATLDTRAPEAAEERVTLESEIRSTAAKVLPVVDARHTLNAFAQYRAFQLRNVIFRIRANSKRPLLPSRYDLNKQFMMLLADSAKRLDIDLVMYVIPLNPTANTPYVQNEYDAFKEWVEGYAAAEHISFSNLERAVPIEQWGFVEGEPDFKHFTAEGHRTTADALWTTFGTILSEPAKAAR